MRILFDSGVPKALRNYLKPHTVERSQDYDWEDLDNGDLLSVAAESFDVLITTDSNMKYQRQMHRYDIAVVVLRAFSNDVKRFVGMLDNILTAIENTPAGYVAYVYEDERLLRKDERKGKG